MIDRSRNKRAFATTTAIVYAAVLSVIVGSMSVNLAAHFRRTVAAKNDAQIRQFILAGAVSARMHLDENSHETEWRVPMPDDAAQAASASIAVSIAAANASVTQRDALIVATLEDSTQKERARFTRRDDRWVLTSISPE